MTQETEPIDLSWAKQNEIGRERGEEFVDRIRAGDVPFLLGHMVKDLVESQKFTGIEVGFFHAISMRLKD